MDRLLTAEQVCDKLQISKRYLYRLTSEQRIAHYKMGQSLRFREREVEEWMERRRVPEDNPVRHLSIV
jgi:excisionase family DNA binding protein